MLLLLPFCSSTENSKFTTIISSKKTFEKICCSKGSTLRTIVCKTFLSRLCSSQNRSDLFLIKQKSVEHNLSNLFKSVKKVPKIFNHQNLSNRIATGIRRKRQEFEDYVDSKKRIDESIDKSLEALDDFNFHLSNLTESVERNLSNSTKSVIDEVPKLQIHPSQSNDSAPGIPQKRQEIEDEFDSKKRIDASLDESLENRNLDEDNEEFPENSDDQYAIDELPDPVTLKKGLESVMEDVIEPQFKDVDPELFSKRKEGLENHVLAIESIYSLIGLILSAIVIILPIYTFFLVVLMYRYTTTVITE